MKPRERLLAAFHKEPCDAIPFAPLVEGYFQASHPDRATKDIVDIQYELTGHILVRTAVARVNTPIYLGAFNVQNPPDGVTERLYFEGEDIVHVTETPVGSLTWRLQYRPESPYIPWIKKNRILTVEDIKTYQWLLERTKMTLALEPYLERVKYVGERGLVLAMGPPISPMQNMINLESGLETFVYLLADYPDEMNEMLETAHAAQKESWKVHTEAPVEFFFVHDNLSSTTTSRPMYRRYDRRFTNDYADILHAAGKKLIMHWCGRLTVFADDFAESKIDGISDVTPLPTGDTNIVEARKTWAKRWIVMGGIDPTLFARGTPEEMTAYVEDLLGRMTPDRRGFILGSGDAVPYGTPLENLKAAAAAAMRFSAD